MNWRKPLILFLLKIKRSSIIKKISFIREIQYDKERISEVHDRQLEDLIRHCYQNVPYYREKLEENNIVVNGNVKLENFDRLPILTKKKVRKNFEDLKSDDIEFRNSYKNSTGGSTGKPVSFLLDQNYKEWNYSNKIYYAGISGKDLGETEIKLWGSPRDLSRKKHVKNKIINFLYNRTLLDSFRMSKSDMRSHVDTWNRKEPAYVWAYVNSIYELASYIEENNLEVFSPKSIVTTAGVLNEEVRNKIERVFDTKVINQYGSREVGNIAVECLEPDGGLHILEHTHHVEILGEENNPVTGEHGNIVVTNLRNYSMPLLRYKIEDTGIMSEENCSCGRKFKMLEKVTGRKTNHFKNSEGEIIHGEYFTHLFYQKDWIRRFRVIQRDLRDVLVRIETRKKPIADDVNQIKKGIKQAMGEKCKIKIEYKNYLKPAESGKFLYTESKIRGREE